MAEKNNTVHSVYFLDCGGHLLGDPVRVQHGQAAQPPAYTPPESLEHFGWSRPTSCVTETIYCVALTREKKQKITVNEATDCRVLVLELRRNRRVAMLPLGNWAKGETLTREDLACLHLRHVDKLRPFRCTVSGDTLLAITDTGVRAFDYGMRPLEGMLELMPMPHYTGVRISREGQTAREA